MVKPNEEGITTPTAVIREGSFQDPETEPDKIVVHYDMEVEKEGKQSENGKHL